MTPGEIVALVHAAILAAEHEPARVELEYGEARVVRRVDVQLRDDQSEAAGFAVLMNLFAGHTDLVPFAANPRYGYLTGRCERVGVDVRVWVITPLPAAVVEPEAVAAP